MGDDIVDIIIVIDQNHELEVWESDRQDDRQDN
jgi:hypothetical protein